MNNLEILLALLRSEICSAPLPNEVGSSLSFQRFHDVFEIANFHDLGHLVYSALDKNKLLPKPCNEEEKQYLRRAYIKNRLALSRYMKSEIALSQIKQTLTENNIDFVPLKGSIIRNFYPEPWMRTSCDIDILVHQNDLKKSIEALKKVGFETEGKPDHHDVSLTQNDVHLELHFSVCESIEKMDKLLSQIWSYTEKIGQNEYRENLAFLSFHLIAHTAYHFIRGGCGMRPILDLWLIRKSPLYDEIKIRELCEKAGLLTFYDNFCALCSVWLDKGVHTEITREMETYIVSSGVYGTMQNSISSSIIRRGGKKGHILNLIIKPYDDLKIPYPIIEKYRFLTPVFEIVRLFDKVANGKTKTALESIKNTKSNSDDNVESMKKLIEKLGIEV